MSDRPVLSYEHATRMITLPVPKAFAGTADETEKLVELFREGLLIASGKVPSVMPIERVVHMELERIKS